jgi:predicted nucleotidyltransferase
MKTFKEIQTILHAHVDELRDRYGITDLAVFGSVVRGEAREDSDVDILADVPLSVNFIDLMGAELYLCDLLNVNVDLIPRGEKRRELRERILTEAVPI